MRKYKTKKFIHESGYVAEVEIELFEEDHDWSPYMSLKDAEKLDSVRDALRQGDVNAAAKMGRIYEMRPVAAE